MKKIYWWIQQINRIGGTEMVSIDLANELVNHYDITFISTVKIKGDIPYKMDPRIKVISLGISRRCEQFDYLSHKYLSHFRIFSFLFLFLQVMFYYIIRRPHYQRVVRRIVNKDDATLICSSADTYRLCPKKTKAYFHYHFDSESFFTRDSFFIRHSRVPDKFIFLCDATRKAIISKRKDLEDKSVYIYNPVRYDPVLNTDYNNNTIIFVGRLADQKDPLLALDVARELKSRNYKFKLKMFGDGPIKDVVEKYYQDNNLQDVVEMHGFKENIAEELLKSDVMLVTSKYEGFSLVMSEANANSRPWISSNWGSILKERLANDRNGIIVDSRDPKDYADAIIKLLDDKDKLKAMKIASYEESKKLAKSSIIPEWIKILG